MIIEVNNLVKRYKGLIALDHSRLEVERGEILELLGPNGSGKTAAINCVLTLLTYGKGDIRVFGEQMKVDGYDLEQQIGVVPQSVAVFHKLSVEDNINYFCGLYVSDRAERRTFVGEAIRSISLEEFHKFRPGRLSDGSLRGLNITCGVAHQPELIFMDEPTAAVDPQSRNTILEGMWRLNAQGTITMCTSHYMEEVEKVCSHIVVINKGKTTAANSKKELKTGITMKEKTEVERMKLQEQQVQDIQNITNVFSMQCNANVLQVKFIEGKCSLTDLLDYFTQENITYGKVYSRQPTLSDVFLKITGKQLQD